MPRLFRLILLIAVQACAFWASVAFAETSNVEPATPKIALERTEDIVPTVKEGQTLTAQFAFINQGQADLVVESVTTSCGCTLAQFDKVTKPGGKGVINLELHTSGIAGSYRKTATVKTNDPTNPSITLIMTGESVSQVKVDKGRNLKLEGCLDQNPSISFNVSDAEGGPLVIVAIENSLMEYLDVVAAPRPDGRSYDLTLRSRVKEPKNFTGPINLLIPDSPMVSIHVTANIRGPFTIQPQEIHFGEVKMNLQGKVGRTILVQNTCADKLIVGNILYNHDHFKLEERWSEPEQKLKLVVSPRTENLPAGPFEERLGIESNGKVYDVLLKGIIM
ncbi:MAG: DUF1573 domain-containing protein [Desulfarculus sp.]|nr:DUF1573 domain-containing protein [Desulfarculus sp.]